MSENRIEKAGILIVEDESDIRRFLRTTLQSHGFATAEAGSVREALQQATARRPDVVLLDLGLPDGDGLDLIRELRGWTQTPVIVLSAREREADKITALDLGADDYLTKPFAAGELIARVRVALRHAARLKDDGGAVYSYEGLEVDLATRRVTLDGAEVRLTPIEYRLLGTLVKNAGKVVTHGHLLREVWGRHSADNSTYLRIHTQHLREKLGDDALNPRFILTEPGVGYRLKA